MNNAADSTSDYKIFPLGDAALTIDWGNRISAELNSRVLRLAAHFDKNPFPGLIETVPAYASLTCFYDVAAVRKNFPESATAFGAVEKIVESALAEMNDIADCRSRLVKIPICFAAEYALDVDFLAANAKVSAAKLIEIFLAPVYRVYLLGFLPGFSYLGEVDERIAAPRRDAPRLRVPKGSIGIAGRQTGIYSLASPGGWQIVGRTNVEMFTPHAEQPTFLRAGDAVRFYESNF